MVNTRGTGVGLFWSIIHGLLLVVFIVNIYGGNAERSEKEQVYVPQMTAHDDAPHEWEKEMFPNPRNHSEDFVYSCGHRENISWVCDPNEILSDEEAEELNDIADKIRQATPCVCPMCYINATDSYQDDGYVIAIAIVNRMVAEYKEQFCPTRKELIQEANKFATHLRTTSWDFGECGNDVIVLYSREENVLVTSTGDEASKVLQATHIQHLYEKTQDYLDAHEYFEGLKYLLGKYNRTLVTGEGIHNPLFTPLQLYFIVFAAVVVPCMIFVFIFINCYDPGEYKFRKRRRESNSDTESFKSCPERA